MKKSNVNKRIGEQQLRVQRNEREGFDEDNSFEERGLVHRESIVNRNDYFEDED